MDSPAVAEQTERPYISTGHLLEAETVQKLVFDTDRRFKSNPDGENSQVYPALARVRAIYSAFALSIGPNQGGQHDDL
jgi:glutaminase